MTRKKVNLQWLSNSSSRRATFKRRRAGLLKKAEDLATLCNVKVCVVVYGDGETQPTVWPSNEVEAKQILTQFKEMPEVGSFKMAKNQETFLDARGSKLNEQVRKLEHENHEHETLFLLHDSMDGRRPGLVGAGEDELVSLRKVVEMKMSKINARIKHLIGKQAALPEQPLVSPPVSSSPQMQAFSSNYTEMQRMIQPVEQNPVLQQDWQVEDPSLNEAELNAMLSSVFGGSSSEPSGSGCDVMQPAYNLGPYSGFP